MLRLLLAKRTRDDFVCSYLILLGFWIWRILLIKNAHFSEAGSVKR